MLPRVALVDPLLTLSCPPAVTASSGLDALTQCLEPFVSALATPVTDALAREGLCRAASGLRPAYQHGADVAARTSRRRRSPKGDVIGGIVSTAGMIPVAFALRDLVNGGRLVRTATHLAMAGMASIVVLSALLVTDVMTFEVQAAVAVPAVIVMFVWIGLVGRAGMLTGASPVGSPSIWKGYGPDDAPVSSGIAILRGFDAGFLPGNDHQLGQPGCVCRDGT